MGLSPIMKTAVHRNEPARRRGIGGVGDDGDARELASMAPQSFDAVYCSHNLEHYYGHDGNRALRGFCPSPVFLF